MGYDFYDKPISNKIHSFYHNFYLWFWRMGCSI